VAERPDEGTATIADPALRGTQFLIDQAGNALAIVGRVTLMVVEMFRVTARRLPSLRLILQQMDVVGVESLWLVIVVSLFTGAVAAVQAAYQFSNVVPLRYIGSVVLRSVVIELGPVLTALVVGGRVGASIAAELGTMKVTEQIDALRAMGINPIRFLVVPRVIAGIVMLPVITIYADAIAVFGGWLVSWLTLGVSSHTYIGALRQYFYLRDVASGLLKAMFFGGIISTMGCYAGFQTEGGASGVGRATTTAVVSLCVMVLILDYVLANFLFRMIFAKS
jgi:phospholipid/cholesterol/gamma-HCH transport system permease protein